MSTITDPDALCDAGARSCCRSKKSHDQSEVRPLGYGHALGKREGASCSVCAGFSPAQMGLRKGKNGVVLRTGDEFQLRVWFAPAQAGSLAGTLTITQSANSAPLGIALSGTGVLKP